MKRFSIILLLLAATSVFGVDENSGSLADPTRNVLELVKAAISREDDLRAAEARRVDEVRIAESRRIDELLKLRSEYEERLASAEKLRIDAIRAVDVNAVAVASQRAADQAQVLAKQVTDSAEALRTLVASTASTVAAAQQQLSSTLSSRITTLEQAQYEGKGKSGVTDPALTLLAQDVSALLRNQSAGVGKSEGLSLAWAILLGAITVGSILFGMAMNSRNRKLNGVK